MSNARRLRLICWMFALCNLLLGCGRSADSPPAQATRAVAPAEAATSEPAATSAAAANPVSAEPPPPEPTRVSESAPATRGTPAPDLSAANQSAPAPAPVGTVVVFTDSLTLPTYPYEDYQTPARSEAYGWPYQAFDYERFEADLQNGVIEATPRDYELLVLENAYLRLEMLPSLGGRIRQVTHKPSGNAMFYENAVVKPSRWGPGEQRGWLALGGLEWGLPVVEHGYSWGEPWGYLPLQQSEDLATITVFTPGDGRVLNASVTVSLLAGAASFQIEPTVSNLSSEPVDFDFWHAAALAPGPTNALDPSLRFVLPADEVAVHTSFDPALPAGETVSWPTAPDGRNLSVLGSYRQYAGLFEAPGARGPFAAVYNPAADAGAVRTFPAEIARGSKIFTLGWDDPLPSTNYTDDGSAYVELHGGLTPTFDEQFSLPPAGSVKWREVWYPAQQIGGVSFANELAALHAARAGASLEVGFYPTRPLVGALIVLAGENEIARVELNVAPDAPFRDSVAPNVPTGPLTLQFVDEANRVLLETVYE